MRKIDPRLVAAFKEAAREYRDAIKQSYTSRPGDEVDIEAPKSKIIDLFKNCPESSRARALLILVKILANPAQGDGATRLNAWLSHLLFELIEKIERV